MKKLLYLSLLVSAPIAANAQAITITQADAPSIGETWTELTDYRYGEHQITAPGAAQTWDYSNAFVVDDTVVTNFVAVSSVPAAYSADYPNADLAAYTPGDSAAVFFKKNATGFYVDGLGMEPVSMQGFTITSTPFNPDLMIVPLPFTYGDTRSHTAKMIIESSLSGIQARYVLTTYQTFSADAYGTLTTPNSGPTNVLRVREFSYSVDTSYINGFGGWMAVDNTPPHDTTIAYTFFKNGGGGRVMYMQEDPLAPGTSMQASYLQNVVISAPEQMPAAPVATVYPNPASNQPVTFDIEHANASRLVITDMLGRHVQTENVTGLNRLVLTTSHLSAGTYLYSLTDKTGSKVSNGRFAVVK